MYPVKFEASLISYGYLGTGGCAGKHTSPASHRGLAPLAEIGNPGIVTRTIARSK